MNESDGNSEKELLETEIDEYEDQGSLESLNRSAILFTSPRIVCSVQHSVRVGARFSDIFWSVRCGSRFSNIEWTAPHHLVLGSSGSGAWISASNDSLIDYDDFSDEMRSL